MEMEKAAFFIIHGWKTIHAFISRQLWLPVWLNCSCSQWLLQIVSTEVLNNLWFLKGQLQQNFSLGKLVISEVHTLLKQLWQSCRAGSCLIFLTAFRYQWHLSRWCMHLVVSGCDANPDTLPPRFSAHHRCHAILEVMSSGHAGFYRST